MSLANIKKITLHPPSKRDELDFMADKQKYLAMSFQHTFEPIKMVGDFCNRQPLFYDMSKSWWVWNKELYIYERSDEINILNSLRYTFDLMNIVDSRFKSQVIEAMKLVSRDRTPIDAPVNWIQFGKKLIDINTPELKEFIANEDYFLTNSLPYEPSDNTDTPEMDKLFCEWVGADYSPVLYEILAYCCLRDYPIHRIFCLNGSGSNGKSCFIQIIEKFLGVGNSCSSSLERLTSNSFATASLYKKLACFMSETNLTRLDKTEIIKKLSGNDQVEFEFKGHQAIPGHNYAKIIISSNALPPTIDTTDGFYRRWSIIDFPNRFTEKEDVLKRIPEQEYHNLSRKIIYILSDLLKRRSFTNDGSIEERRQRYEDRSNPLQKFLSEHTEKDPDSHIFKYEFKEAFTDYLKKNNQRNWSETEIGKTMKEHYEEQRKAKEVRDEVKYYWAWVGLKWKVLQGFQGFQPTLVSVSYIGKSTGKGVESIERVTEERML